MLHLKSFFFPMRIWAISQINNLPYDEFIVKKRMAFMRNKFYSKKYPLDSSLFMNLKQVYKYNNLPKQKDYACTGVLVFNAKKHSTTDY